MITCMWCRHVLGSNPSRCGVCRVDLAEWWKAFSFQARGGQR